MQPDRNASALAKLWVDNLEKLATQLRPFCRRNHEPTPTDFEDLETLITSLKESKGQYPSLDQVKQYVDGRRKLRCDGLAQTEAKT
jgi:hypothetical protein